MSDKKLFICMYHYTRDLSHSRYPRIRGMETALLREQFAFFKEHFHVVRMEEVIEAVKGVRPLPESALLLTFDDGYIDNYTCAFPLLEEFGFQGSFFIPGKTFADHELLDVNKIHYILASADIAPLYEDVTARMEAARGGADPYPSLDELKERYLVPGRFDDPKTNFVKRILQTALPEHLRGEIAEELFEKYVGITSRQLAYELYMTADQIRTLKRHGMFIGLHGYDHYWLGNLSAEEMRSDITRALEVMEPFIDRDEWVMNYPYGSYNEEVTSFVARNGAVLGLTTQVRAAVIGTDPAMELPRLDCNDFPPKGEAYAEWA